MDQMFKAIVGIVLRASVKTKIKTRAEGVAQHARGFQFNLRTEKKKILQRGKLTLYPRLIVFLKETECVQKVVGNLSLSAMVSLVFFPPLSFTAILTSYCTYSMFLAPDIVICLRTLDKDAIKLAGHINAGPP